MTDTKIIKKRIRTARNIAQITKAMEMVAASKMRRSQQQALAARPYSHALQKILFSLLENEVKLEHRLMRPNRSQLSAILLITTDKGLCGGLNTNHFRVLRSFIAGRPAEKLRLLIIGRKGREFLRKSRFQVLADFPQIKENFVFEDTLPVSRFLINSYLNHEIGPTFISFTNFISTLSQKPKIIQLLPVSLDDLGRELGILALGKAEIEAKKQFGKKEYLIEPSPKMVGQWLLPYFIELIIYYYLLEAKAAEHSARMVAMKNASDNAGEILRELNLSYNKARQIQITSQLADLTTAMLAMKN